MTNRQFLIVLVPFLAFLLGVGFCVPKRQSPVAETVQVKKIYLHNVERLDSALNQLKNTVTANAPSADVQRTFSQARAAFKRIEFIAEYYNPYTVKSMNGPNLPEVEFDDPNQRIIAATGFQVLEEVVFPAYETASQQEALKQINVLRSCMNRLRHVSEETDFTDTHLFNAMRQEVFRIITLGISGFDSPVAFRSMTEAAAALTGLQETFAVYQPRIGHQSPKLVEQLNQLFVRSQQYLQTHAGFDSFDRATFITTYANPLSAHLLDAQQELHIPFSRHLQAVSATARTLFDKDAFNVNYFAPDHQSHLTPARVELGKLLFFDPVLSGNGSRSCASCHKPEKAFTDGLPKSVAFNFEGKVSRNAPTIINAGLQRSLFHDMRVVYLEDQATDVMQNKAEMHGSMEKSVLQISRSDEYRQLFTNAFPEAPDETVSERNLKVALASYIRSLSGMNSRFDQYMRGDSTILSAGEKNGFNVFMGKAKCGTCHFMPLFNGTVPPNFDKSEAEILGVPKTADTLRPELDADLGKFALYNKDLHKFAFKTPTVRNAELTAPYMHNGVYQTLEEVVDFYNKGGGTGLGLNVPHQTLPADKLNLTETEKRDLIAFMQTLTDTSAANIPTRLPEFPQAAALGKRVVGGKY